MPRARIDTRPQTPLPLAIASLCLASSACSPARHDTTANSVMATSVPIVAPARPICSITYSLPCHACSRLTPAKSIICRLFAPSPFCFLFSVCASKKLSSRLPLAHPSFAMLPQSGVIRVADGAFRPCQRGPRRRPEHERDLWENKKVSFKVYPIELFRLAFRSQLRTALK